EMAERRRANRGLERPELAVLLAYAKRALTGALLRSDLPEEPFLAAALRGYFPPLVVDRFDHLLGEHPLRRELVATIVANHVLDALGPTFVSRLMFELGAQPADVVRAYLAARDLVGATDRWEAIERLDRSVARSGSSWRASIASSRRQRAGTSCTASRASTSPRRSRRGARRSALSPRCSR